MKILFIGNTASRTGAPIGLLHLLRWLREHSDIEFELLLRWGGGPLQAEYESICRVIAYSDLWCSRGLHHRLARRFGMRTLFGRSCLSPAEETFKDSGIDLIYANTITHGGILTDLASLGCPVLCHVHELDSEIERYGRRNLAQVKALTGTYIADSEATRQNLVRQHGVSADATQLAYEFIVVDDSPDASLRSGARRLLGVGEEAFIVGGSGYPYWRKGKDLFVALAERVNRSNGQRPIHFVWVGGEQEGEDAERLRADIQRAGVDACVHVLPQVEEPAMYYAAFDVFALVSREEPFGMVNLEAAMFGCPVLCFKDAGGAPEFVEEDAGYCVDYLDVDAMAEKVIVLAGDEAQRDRMGERARSKVRERHDVSVVAPQIVEIIRGVMKGGDHG
jgi:glycosyltransferase involved in cell wall biosynthesis